MEKIKNLKINWKKTISVLLTTTVLSTLSGCCFEEHEEVINEQNNKINTLEQNIAELEKSKQELENLNAQLQEQINELTATPQPTVVPESTTSYNDQESISSSLIDLYSTYSYVGDEFKSQTGDICRKIRTADDYKYEYGIYNVTKSRFDIPYKTYDYIGDEYISNTGDVYRKVSVPNDEAYEAGIYNVSQCREEIPCRTYKEIHEVEDGMYQCITPDDQIKVYTLK